jgi:hypothetical protein
MSTLAAAHALAGFHTGEARRRRLGNSPGGMVSTRLTPSAQLRAGLLVVTGPGLDRRKPDHLNRLET